MDKFIVGAVFGAVVALLGVALYVSGQERIECEAKGGVKLYHEGCVKLERIK